MTENRPEIPTRLEKERIFSSAKSLCLQWATDALPPYLEQLDYKLFKLADKATSNAEQSRYFQSRDEIRQHQTVIQERFLRHLTLAFDHYLQGMNTSTDFSVDPMMQKGTQKEMQKRMQKERQQGQRPTAPVQPIREENLSLVNHEELEEKLAIASMSRRRAADNSEAIYALNQRLAVLRGGVKLTDHSNPFAPGVFSEALQFSLANLTLDETARLMIYKVFDHIFLVNLKILYQQLNTHLQNNGVLPNLSYYVKKTPEEILADLPDELKNQLSDISLNRQLELIRAIQLLQSQLHPPAAIRRPAGVVPISIEQLLASIQQLQHSASDLLGRSDLQPTLTSSDSQQLRQQVEEQIRRSSDVDENVIEIVGLLFEYMLNDQQLPDSVKTLLSYLHTPFLKIALLDKEFFNHPEHPARQLLNSLVAAGERWVEPIGKRKSEVYEQIRKVVHRVLKEFDNDIRLFSELAFEFNHYLRQHSRRIRLLEQRATQAAQGENTLKEIRLRVERYLKAKIGGMHLPAPLQTLLFEPWANFLAFNLLRFGSRSEQWRQAAQVVDDILWYCQPHNVEADIHARKRIEELQQILPAVLQTGFDTVGYDSTQSQRLIAMLKQRQRNTLTPIPATVTSPAPDIDQIDISQPPDTRTVDPLLEKLKALKPDTWFEFDVDTPQPLRVKLAWFNGNTMHFMFVNRLGQQVAIKTGQQLAEELRQGKTRKLASLEDRPFFEKAMERILDQLKQRADSGAG